MGKKKEHLPFMLHLKCILVKTWQVCYRIDRHFLYFILDRVHGSFRKTISRYCPFNPFFPQIRCIYVLPNSWPLRKETNMFHSKKVYWMYVFPYTRYLFWDRIIFTVSSWMIHTWIYTYYFNHIFFKRRHSMMISEEIHW